MGEAETRVAQIALPDGTEVWARVSDPGELPSASGDGFADTGVADRAAAQLESFHGLVTGVARSLADAARSVRPDEVSVEFGIELTAKSGKVVGLLADGEAKGAIKVTLTWRDGPPAGLDAGPDGRPDATAASPARPAAQGPGRPDAPGQPVLPGQSAALGRQGPGRPAGPADPAPGGSGG
ncbi:MULTISPECIES: CU044_2847 family protein [Streptomyces]|uniref:Trypsin-co-occurring domain-containing protein n=1 Tax=Streptomyces lycii TaxID=2654337 RepID=A0ABQ7FMS3_9ACTN|nr:MULTISPECIES: CU044_2847 family protein [Streptomyces]KAF4410232.1 hypothetical protein GCU69_04925 [Streptomyces lycii]PGH52322.1 hypothetical protein CRI70_02140 [Streptomyces sp. Ru87]